MLYVHRDIPQAPPKTNETLLAEEDDDEKFIHPLMAKELPLLVRFFDVVDDFEG